MGVDDIRAHYRQLFLTHGDSPQAVQYSSLKSQERRLELLIEVGNLSGRKILDFGCGTGQLGTLLLDRKVDVEYCGVDLVSEFVELCRHKFPTGRFGTLSDFEGERFDYVFISGVFNNRMPDNVAFYQETIRTLFAQTVHALAFNMMSAYVDYQNPNLFYEYPEKVFSFLKRDVTPFVMIRNDYEVKEGVVPFDFTAYAFRRGR